MRTGKRTPRTLDCSTSGLPLFLTLSISINYSYVSCDTTKNREISTKVHITYYDNNNSLVTNHNIYHDAPEDKTEEIPSNYDYDDGLSKYDEENIGCQTGERPDEDNKELDFNY